MCFEMSVERSVLKIYCPESLLSFVSKFFEKLGSSRYFDYLVEFFFFSYFQFTGLLAVLAGRVARVFKFVWS